MGDGDLYDPDDLSDGADRDHIPVGIRVGRGCRCSNAV